MVKQKKKKNTKQWSFVVSFFVVCVLNFWNETIRKKAYMFFSKRKAEGVVLRWGVCEWNDHKWFIRAHVLISPTNELRCGKFSWKQKLGKVECVSLWQWCFSITPVRKSVRFIQFVIFSLKFSYHPFFIHNYHLDYNR